ncbi:glycosyltransferase family 2 protein [Paraburkholderia tagetis]|uniref:Glycosyltransferase family 2 protein n=1 Tax=Paraburkholderia tagetis TaxID=2913261 RepID=A0A9X1UGP4_9BURK|nr:glycosyltransferase family A protein [Paraburkholderia tagetis]MCG5075715.1 glycosyltransferase family 2 protein [Paraburkholderia tagetis]
MKRYVIVATKGRPVETATLLDFLHDQDARPDGVYIVGASAADLPDAAGHPLLASTRVALLVGDKPGSTTQRNVGIEALLKDAPDAASGERWFASFFDDDFRPHRGWLRACEALFTERDDVIGMTGQLLADGVKGSGISEADALRYLSGEREREPHWASGERREIGCAYGCNMAFVDRVIRQCRFDEALPLYGWQEDYDFTAHALLLGTVVYEPGSIGVHLGTKRGRTSGVRFGYSQIANPLYLARKHTMHPRRAWRFISRHLCSNLYHSVRGHPLVDYRGRLKGNVLAFVDMMKGVIHPQRILEL